MSEVKPAIVVKNLNKTFRLPHERYSGLKQKILNVGKAGKGYEVQKVLNDISFEIKKGEFFGIVGRNGSGKSTLLKTIAGIYAPDSGKVSVNGTLVPFIELGVGFNPELTGRENVFLNGALLGFSRKEMEVMYDEIVEFAELERFMDQKLKNYSSGMQVRLAFSIAIRAQGDILLLDEVLAVGDAAFQRKCFDYFEQLKREKKTVILVTHSMANVERFCNRALLLDGGKISRIGSSYEIADLYHDLFAFSKDKSSLNSEAVAPKGLKASLAKVTVTQNGSERDKVKALEPFNVTLYLKSSDQISGCRVVLRMLDSNDNIVFAHVSSALRGLVLEPGYVTKVDFKIDNFFTGGSYSLNVSAKGTNEDGDREVILDAQNIIQLKISSVDSSVRSMFHPPVVVTAEREQGQ